MELVFPIEMLVFLFLIAIAAGAVDTLAGGGGLIALPALIISGIPPLTALGTNKLQSWAGTGTSTLMMLRYKKITLEEMLPTMLMAFIGSILGTISVQFIDNEKLSLIIPIVIFLILIYFVLTPKMSVHSSEPRLTESSYKKYIAPIIGFYDGMFGPGTGSFFTASGIALRGKNLIDATARAKALNFSTNVAAVIVFIYIGEVVWVVGLVMILGQFIGARVGSIFLININPSYLRVFVILLCTLMLLLHFQSS
jgi:uncharacterized membrane protein YfcA|tara:strand:+ start:369 stop:1127 length:759 start_codon:yes stop_codon:yes gene_type:complete